MIRLVDAVPPNDPVARVVADEIGAALADETAFTGAEQGRIRARLAAAIERPRPWRWRPVVVAVVIFLLGSTVGAAVLERVIMPRLRGQESPAPTEAPRAVAVTRPRTEAPPLPQAPSTDASELPAEVPAPPVAPPPTAAHGVGRGPRAVPRIDAPAAAPKGVETEATSMAAILRLLRHEHDPRAALVALDAHERAYPGGVLVAETARARVDALIAVGRSDDALAVLDRISFRGTMRSPEMQTLRGELRAKYGRCADAIEDFSAVIATGRPDLDERALFGRANCRLRSGNTSEAEGDLRAYRALFPQGRFIEQVRKMEGP